MWTIDNRAEKFGDDLKGELSRGSKLRIAASTFSIYAFEALQRELEQIGELEFIFTSPTFVANRDTDRLPKERRQFFIPHGNKAESSLYGSEFEIRLRNRMTQRAIARECAAWIRKKAAFRSNRTQAPMQQFATVDESTAYLPLQGFTAADLGYERGDAVSNFVNKMDEAPQASNFIQLFDQIWNDPDRLEDVTASVLNHIESVYAENSPARVYFLILYNIFSEFLEDISEDVLADDRTGYKDTKIWDALYDFQSDAAAGIINKLETYNGCILADSVGLGKTFTALAVIKYYELRNKSVLVLVPKRLGENWTNYNANLTTNLFAEDRFGYDVLAHTDLLRTSGESFGKPLDRINWGNYNLVVIDESHNFRNNPASREKETRYERLLRQVVREGVNTKVLMLSATPVNNRFLDLKNQLALAYGGESGVLEEKLGVKTSIDEIFRQAQRVFNDWAELPPDERTAESILKRLNFDFFELLDAVTIARSRRHIEAFYDNSKIGGFPERRPPESIQSPLTDLPGVPSMGELFDLLTSLTMAVYAPLSYVFPSRLAKYEDTYGGQLSDRSQARGDAGNLGQKNREKGIQKLMAVNLLKRLESSVEAFRLTLGKMSVTVGDALVTIESHTGSVADLTEEFGGFDADDEDFDLDGPSTVGAKVQVELEDIDLESWRRDLENDKATFDLLLEEMSKVTPQHDLKLNHLKSRIVEKTQHPFNQGNRKLLIFSAFTDTAEYLYRELTAMAAAEGLALGLVSGSGRQQTTLGKGFNFQQILALFAPRAKSRDLIMKGETREIDLLIGTDCISEGQNLQDCDCVINYDIHWNPVRIIQRFGRIDRIGSPNESIQLINFWPDIDLDDYINLRERVESRMIAADITATGDDNPLDQKANETEFRRQQLKRLQEEVIELEDVRTGASITDLGLNEFRMDLINHVQEYGELADVPKGLHAVVPARPDRGLQPGVIFALRNVSAGEEINRHNRLHPHYLVYVDREGQPLADHTEVKVLLDLIRTSCRDLTEPVAEVCRVFNSATGEGADMDAYSELLTAAIRSMIEVTEERDIDSLFTDGTTTALTQSIAGLEDFELIAFLAIVNPSEGTTGET